MSLFAPFIYTNKQGKKFWMHSIQRGKAILYYFSTDPIGALTDLPKGYEVAENQITGMPFLKKKTSTGFISNVFGSMKTKKGKKEEQEKTE
jgi:hypothetical protein